MVEIDCEKSMKLETSPNVTKSKRSLHWCRSISKKLSAQVLLQYQSKSYYIIGQEVYYSIGRFYYITGHLLQYRAFFITLSGTYDSIGWYKGSIISRTVVPILLFVRFSCKRWVHNLSRARVVAESDLVSRKNPDLIGTKHLYLCEEHFTADQFMNPKEKGMLYFLTSCIKTGIIYY